MAGFPVVRRLGESVWEAVQPALERRVALTRLPPGTAFRPAVWPDHPGVVDLFAVVDGEDGTYVVTRFVPGARTLAELSGARASRRRRWLDEVAATLEDTVHGDLTAEDILIDSSGRALVTGFGRGDPEATAADDLEAIAGLRPPPPPRVRAAWAVAGAVGAIGVIVAVGLGVATTGGGDDRPPAPPVPAGAVAYGSPLASGVVDSVDCEDRRPAGDSLACTILQGGLAGRPLATTTPVRIRSWVVEGARGRMRLQVLQRDGERFRVYVSGRPVTVPADGVHLVPEDLVVPAGVWFALEVAPGSAVGIRDGVEDARTLRFYGPLRGDLRTPDAGRGAGQELLLRVDAVPVG